jgi:rubrerythrin
METENGELRRALDHADALLGGLTRRRLFRVAGFSVASAAVLAACGKDAATSTNIPQAGLTPVTTALPNRIIDDITLLRTASSLEHNAIDAYEALLSKITDAKLHDTISLFLEHHQAHATSAEAATKQLGGDAFTEKNPVVDSGIVQPALALVTDGGGQAADIAAFAYALETVAAETYQSFVPLLSKPGLRSSVMIVGGSEARHAAILAALIKDASPVAPMVTGTGSTTAAPTTTIVGTTTTLKGGNPPPIYQVPGIFQPLTPAEVGINRVTITADLLGPNSYMYVPAQS